MAERPPRKFLNATTFGLTLLGCVLVLSMISVVHSERELTGRPGETVLRLCHWQLEDGFRDGLQAVIDDYQAVKKAQGVDVRIIQMPITEKVYSQWLNTQLISGSAPDLIEAGQSKLAYDDEPAIKYFQAMGGFINKPNPYNVGTDLEGVPWRDTARDGMQSGYRPKLVDYYSIPCSLIGTRTFVNLTLLKKITGSAEPPKTFGEWVAIGEKVASYAARTGEQMRAVTSSYQLAYFYGRYKVAFTAGLQSVLDANIDGLVTPVETYAGMLRGQVGFDTPQVKGYYEMMDTLGHMMGSDKSAVDRQQAQFMFVQGNAVFMGTGSWDAEGMRTEFNRKGWDLAVIDFPIPAKGERWGDLVAGRAADSGRGGGFPLAVFKSSRNQEMAVDFLQYITSQKANSRFNSIANWPPVTVGAEPSDLMRPFVPDPTGFTSFADFAIGAKVAGDLSGQETKFFNGEITYDQMVSTMLASIKDPNGGGDRAWATEYDLLVRECRAQERVLGAQSARALLDHSSADDAKLKFQRALLQQVRKNNGNEGRKRFEDLRERPIPRI